MRSAIVLVGLALGAAPAPGAEPPARWTPSPRGPTAALAAADGVVARDEGELTRMLADPAGPRAIRLEGHAYEGNLRIARPVRLRGVPGTVLQGDDRDTVITIEGGDVDLEDVVVRGSGGRHTAEDAGVRATGHDVHVRDVLVEDTLFGIRYAQCTSCSIERTHIVGRDDAVGMRGDGIKIWQSDDALVKDTWVERSRDVVIWYSRRATVDGVRVTGSRYGTHFMYAHDASVRRSRFERDVVGIFVMYSARIRIESSVMAGARGAAGMGVGFKESDDVALEGDWLVGDTAGVYFDRTPRSPDHPVLLRGSVLALDEVALRLHGPEAGVSVRDCDFRENLRPVQVDGGGDALALDIEGNHWTEYEGYDLDGDGRGDVPFQVKALSSDVKEAHPDLRLFEGTVAMALIDSVAEATPMFASQLVLVDRSPRMRAPAAEVPLP